MLLLYPLSDITLPRVTLNCGLCMTVDILAHTSSPIVVVNFLTVIFSTYRPRRYLQYFQWPLAAKCCPVLRILFLARPIRTRLMQPRHMTSKGQTRDPNMRRAQYLENVICRRHRRFAVGHFLLVVPLPWNQASIQWRSNGVGRVGKVQGPPSEGAPEFQANF